MKAEGLSLFLPISSCVIQTCGSMLFINWQPCEVTRSHLVKSRSVHKSVQCPIRLLHRASKSHNSTTKTRHRYFGLYLSFQILSEKTSVHCSNTSAPRHDPTRRACKLRSCQALQLPSSKSATASTHNQPSAASRKQEHDLFADCQTRAVLYAFVREPDGVQVLCWGRTHHEFPTLLCPFSSASRRYCAALNYICRWTR